MMNSVKFCLLVFALLSNSGAQAKSASYGGSNSVNSLKEVTINSEAQCNVTGINWYRLDPSKPSKCIHFTAATDLFVIFASSPTDQTTWYHLQITPNGIGFHHALALLKMEQTKGIGLLGDKNLGQSLFVCHIQESNTVTLQFGKTDFDNGMGKVHAAYTFPVDKDFKPLTYYSLWSGNESVSFIRQTESMPEVALLGKYQIKNNNGQCFLDCHAECNGCKHVHDSKECQQCKNLRIETQNGESKVQECVSLCPPGLSPSEKTAGLCLPCTRGNFKSAAGNTTCEPCPAGSFSSVEGATGCISCPAGTYSYNLGSQKCENCPAGKFSLSGSTSCSDCPAGKFSASEGSSLCVPCPAGTFSASSSSSSCISCPVNHYAACEASVSCSKCNPYQFASTGSPNCMNCYNGLSKDDGVSCYKRVLVNRAACRHFRMLNGLVSNYEVLTYIDDSLCKLAMDLSAYTSFISPSPAEHCGNSWNGYFAASHVRKVLLVRDAAHKYSLVGTVCGFYYGDNYINSVKSHVENPFHTSLAYTYNMFYSILDSDVFSDRIELTQFNPNILNLAEIEIYTD